MAAFQFNQERKKTFKGSHSFNRGCCVYRLTLLINLFNSSLWLDRIYLSYYSLQQLVRLPGSVRLLQMIYKKKKKKGINSTLSQIKHRTWLLPWKYPDQGGERSRNGDWRLVLGLLSKPTWLNNNNDGWNNLQMWLCSANKFFVKSTDIRGLGVLKGGWGGFETQV